MAKQVIEIGTAPAGQDGDTNREASQKCNSNFTELYLAIAQTVRGPSMVGGGEVAVFSGTTGKDIVGGGFLGTAAFQASTAFATAAQGTKADNAEKTLTAGDNVTIDRTDPAHPVISVVGIPEDQALINQEVQDEIDTKVNKTDIVDNLASTDATKVLSAKQGKALYDLIQSNNVSAVAYKYVATAGQAVFTGADATGKVLTLTPGSVLLVTLQGWDLTPADDYTFTGTALTLVSGAKVGEQLNIVAFGTFSVADHYTKAEDDAKFVAKVDVIDIAHGGTGVTTTAAHLAALQAAGAYGKNNIVGTVSQTGGIPTGAIIERGSNSNGYYIKYADGTMICRANSTNALGVNTAGGNIFHSGVPYVFNFPVAFTETPCITVSSITTSTYYCWAVTEGSATANAFTARVASAVNGTSGYLSYIAIGRWF